MQHANPVVKLKNTSQWKRNLMTNYNGTVGDYLYRKLFPIHDHHRGKTPTSGSQALGRHFSEPTVAEIRGIPHHDEEL